VAISKLTYLIKSIKLDSVERRRESVIYIHMYILFTFEWRLFITYVCTYVCKCAVISKNKSIS